jgi:lipopolysaccharide/colanic/teichoic acid biosynthesis glycosyltransferase
MKNELHLYKNKYKRLFDIILSLSALIILFPFIILLNILIIILLGSPTIFTQDRPGLGGKKFKLYKFRTMTNARAPDGNLLPDGLRLTYLGRFLRRTSLDELPELYNVLKGDMSLVGPRPLLTEYLPFYSPHEQRRHSLKPGITGWAQINGRNMCPWNKRLELDVWYVDNCSLILDLKILLLTVKKVINRDGVSEDSNLVEVKLSEERSHR